MLLGPGSTPQPLWQQALHGSWDAGQRGELQLELSLGKRLGALSTSHGEAGNDDNDRNNNGHNTFYSADNTDLAVVAEALAGFCGKFGRRRSRLAALTAWRVSSANFTSDMTSIHNVKVKTCHCNRTQSIARVLARLLAAGDV